MWAMLQFPIKNQNERVVDHAKRGVNINNLRMFYP